MITIVVNTFQNKKLHAYRIVHRGLVHKVFFLTSDRQMTQERVGIKQQYAVHTCKFNVFIYGQYKVFIT